MCLGVQSPVQMGIYSAVEPEQAVVAGTESLANEIAMRQFQISLL